MKQLFHIIFSLLTIIIPTTCASQEQSLIACQQSTYSPLKICIVLVGNNYVLKQIAKVVAFDLSFTDQLDPKVVSTEKTLDKKSMQRLFTKDYSLCVHVTCVTSKKNKHNIAIVINDTETGDTLFRKTFVCSQPSIVRDGHTIASEIIPILSGNNSVTLSSLAYCQQHSPSEKSICISDYACFTRATILKNGALNVAPAWHSDPKYLFYSRFTPRKSTLCCFDFTSKTSRSICSYDGINMQPSCSGDGKQIVLSMSGNKGNTELYLYDQRLCKAAGKRVFKPLTNNGGHNVSPILLPNNNIIFCSDFETGYPQIYHLNTATNVVKRITNKKGYCAGPTLHAQNNLLVYSRLVRKTFQLFCIDLNEEDLKERQLTDSLGDKLDPAWSPCGRYVAFTYDYIDQVTHKRIPQIAVLNFHSGIIRVLTKDRLPKSFVTWTNKTQYIG